MTKCSSSTLTGAIRVRSGPQCMPSNRDLSRVINAHSLGKGWNNDHACNESGRIQRVQGFEAGGHSKTGSLGWASTGKNHSGRGHAIGAHDSLGGIPTSESTAGFGRRGSRRGGGGRGNSLSYRFTCDVYGAVRRLREWNLQ